VTSDAAILITAPRTVDLRQGGLVIPGERGSIRRAKTSIATFAYIADCPVTLRAATDSERGVFIEDPHVGPTDTIGPEVSLRSR
jgi:hypothetical protein